MFLSRLIEEVSVFGGWRHQECRPWPRHQNDTVHSMLSVTIVSLFVPRKNMDYCVTSLETTTSTNIVYYVFILFKSLTPGAFEKSSITDQISLLTPSSISLRQYSGIQAGDTVIHNLNLNGRVGVFTSIWCLETKPTHLCLDTSGFFSATSDSSKVFLTLCILECISPKTVI